MYGLDFLSAKSDRHVWIRLTVAAAAVGYTDLGHKSAVAVDIPVYTALLVVDYSLVGSFAGFDHGCSYSLAVGAGLGSRIEVVDYTDQTCWG